MKSPGVSKDLIEYLEKNNPNRCPNISDSDREIWIAVGVQKVIAHLRKLYEIQLQNVVES